MLGDERICCGLSEAFFFKFGAGGGFPLEEERPLA